MKRPKGKKEISTDRGKCNITHGAFSGNIRDRYSDLRTVEGQQLKAIMDEIVNDLGGPSELMGGQELLLSSIRSKVIIVLQIGRFVDRQMDVIDPDGHLLGCLGTHYLAYSNALRLDLLALYQMSDRKPTKNIDLDKYLAGKGNGKVKAE